MTPRERLRIAVQKSGRLSEPCFDLLVRCGLRFRRSRDGLFCYGEGEPVKIQDNFQMEVQYAFTDNEGSMRNEYFLIDVVSFERLNDISKALERDAGVAIHFMEPT